MSEADVLPAPDWLVREPDEVLTPEDLCSRYGHRVYRFAAMVARGEVEAEDLAQEALIRAIRNLRNFDSRRGTMDTWLWQIVMSSARDAGRVSGRRRALWDRLVSERRDFASTETLALERLQDSQLLSAVRRLPVRERALIALRFGADLDYAAVGRACGLTPAAATMAVRRALARLRVQLEDQL
jgi:RNA polymerase sigma-70 factor (ECF subfamily)